MDKKLGPQYSWDDQFTARMRFHQSWYRAAVLKVDPGCLPDGKCYGNLLSPDDGRRGLNFLSHEFAKLARDSSAQNPRGIEGERLERNLLSSQPMCFNLFGPVVCDSAIAPSLMSALLGYGIDAVIRVVFEHAPQPNSQYLGDRTAFDVFVEYRTPDGQLGFLGVEGKLTEPFSERRYPLAHYLKWVEAPGAPWEPERRGKLDAIQHNQLWRDHMLAFALRERGPERYAFGQLMLVRHQDDPKTTSAVAGYTSCLRQDDTTFIDAPLAWLLEAWRPMTKGTRWETWMGEVERRYSNMSESESLWQDRR